MNTSFNDSFTNRTSFRSYSGQAGFIPHPSDDGLILEIEDPDPWAQDSEPIFWTD